MEEFNYNNIEDEIFTDILGEQTDEDVFYL
jgi:hypothetical protein